MNNLIGQRFERLVAIKRVGNDKQGQGCKRCNMAKRIMTYDEFIEWGKRLGDHLNE
jgi:hypothetical protein